MKPVRFASILVASALLACSGNQSNNANATMQPVSEPADAQAAIEPAPDAQAAIEPAPDAMAEPLADAAADAAAQPALDAAVVASADAGRDAARSSGHTSSTHAGASTGATSGANGGNNAGASAAMADARAVFDRTCGRCHPGGNERIGPRLTGRNDSEAHTRQVVRNGDGTMRAIPASRLSDPDLAKVIVFLRAIRAVR